MNLDTALKKNQKIISLGVILFGVMIGTIIEFTYIDITVHDGYSLEWGALCYTGNTNPDCSNIQTIHNCPNGGDACIEAQYSQMLSEEAFYIAILMIGLKLGISHGLLDYKITGPRMFQTFVWGTIPVVLLWTGWEDYLYYAIRGITIPTQLQWLNGAGLFPYIMQNITHDQNASAIDLYIVMGIGMIIILVLWYFYMVVTRNSDRKIPI